MLYLLFSNFTINEPVEIAARFDETHNVSAASIRQGNWDGIQRGRDFEKRYLQLIKGQNAGLKGKERGEFLDEYAVEYPERPDDQKRHFKFVLDSFQLKEKNK